MKNSAFARILLLAVILLALTAQTGGQELGELFRAAERGDVVPARAALPKLLEQYPNDPAVLFLEAVTTEQAEDALITYRRILQNHASSPFADDAVMRIGEYLFARGLYSQASDQLARLPINYPQSPHVQRAIDLQINSLLAAGASDSAEFYVQVYRLRFPSLDLGYSLADGSPGTARPAFVSPPHFSNDTPLPSPVSLAKLVPSGDEPSARPVPLSTGPTPSSPPSAIVTASAAARARPFVLQVGAFGSEENAFKQKLLLDQQGVSVELVKISSGGKTLTAVQVVRFGTKAEAEAVGRTLKTKLGLNYRVVERPE